MLLRCLLAFFAAGLSVTRIDASAPWAWPVALWSVLTLAFIAFGLYQLFRLVDRHAAGRARGRGGAVAGGLPSDSSRLSGESPADGA